MIVICALGSMAMSSCLGDSNNKAQVYTKEYSVIKSSAGGLYFSSDAEIDLYPTNGFDSKWGNVGDRVLVGFYYNPYAVTETTTKMNITVETLIGVQTDNSALPSSVDTVGNGVFVFENSGDKHAISAWAVQNYLTAIFWLQYSDATKHSFGFIEEPELFRNDTLFLSLWHNTKEDSNNSTPVQWHIALNLSNYSEYLSARDSTTISIKYKAENPHLQEPEEYTCPVIYRKKYNVGSSY
jgi:hypothetical protein